MADINILRDAVRVHAVRFNLSLLAKDVQCSTDSLELFIKGCKGCLGGEVLQRLTEMLFGGMFRYDAEGNSIEKVERPPPKSMGQRPQRWAKVIEWQEGPPPPAAIWPAGPDARPILARKPK